MRGITGTVNMTVSIRMSRWAETWRSCWRSSPFPVPSSLVIAWWVREVLTIVLKFFYVESKIFLQGGKNRNVSCTSSKGELLRLIDWLVQVTLRTLHCNWLIDWLIGPSDVTYFTLQLIDWLIDLVPFFVSLAQHDWRSDCGGLCSSDQSRSGLLSEIHHRDEKFSIQRRRKPSPNTKSCQQRTGKGYSGEFFALSFTAYCKGIFGCSIICLHFLSL